MSEMPRGRGGAVVGTGVLGRDQPRGVGAAGGRSGAHPWLSGPTPTRSAAKWRRRPVGYASRASRVARTASPRGSSSGGTSTGSSPPSQADAPPAQVSGLRLDSTGGGALPCPRTYGTRVKKIRTSRGGRCRAVARVCAGAVVSGSHARSTATVRRARRWPRLPRCAATTGASLSGWPVTSTAPRVGNGCGGRSSRASRSVESVPSTGCGRSPRSSTTSRRRRQAARCTIRRTSSRCVTIATTGRQRASERG